MLTQRAGDASAVQRTVSTPQRRRVFGERNVRTSSATGRHAMRVLCGVRRWRRTPSTSTPRRPVPVTGERSPGPPALSPRRPAGRPVGWYDADSAPAARAPVHRTSAVGIPVPDRPATQSHRHHHPPPVDRDVRDRPAAKAVHPAGQHPHTRHGTGSSRVRAITRMRSLSSSTSSTTRADGPENTTLTRSSISSTPQAGR